MKLEERVLQLVAEEVQSAEMQHMASLVGLDRRPEEEELGNTSWKKSQHFQDLSNARHLISAKTRESEGQLDGYMDWIAKNYDPKAGENSYGSLKVLTTLVSNFINKMKMVGKKPEGIKLFTRAKDLMADFYVGAPTVKTLHEMVLRELLILLG
jgi:hypothetical protein